MADESPKLRLRIFRSITSAVDLPSAEAITGLFAKYFSEKSLKYPIDFAIMKEAPNREELHNLGRQLDEGSIHLAVVWGVEYGWLAKEFPKLRPMVRAVQSKDFFFTQILVRSDLDVKDIKDLRGFELIEHQFAPIMTAVLTDQILEAAELKPQGFFKVRHSLKDVNDAIDLALKTDARRCIVLENTTFARQDPSVLKRLKPVLRGQSDSYPLPVLIGRPDRLDSLRKGMWDEATEKMLRVHTSSQQAKDLIKLWKFTYFDRCSAKHEKEMKQAAEKLMPERLYGSVKR